ncbi:MAG: hypothetical protein EZS28_023131, partial [Streblomastix strix]
MKKERKIEFDKKQQAKIQQQPQPQQSQMQKDPEVNKNQTQMRSELKNPISLIQSDQKTQANPNIDLNYISPQHNTPRKPSSPHLQQYQPSPSLEETLTILRTISPRYPRGYKEREPEPKQPKLQQYAVLMDVIEKFHEIMKLIIEEEKKIPKVMLLRQYKEYPNKDGPLFFFPPKNYCPTPILRPNDLNLSEEQWKQFDGDVPWANLPRGSCIPGLLNVSDEVAGFINIYPQIYQSILEAVIGLIIFAAEQIVQSETETEDQEQLTNELERIVADGTDDNGDNDQSEHAIESKHFTNGNDGLRENDSGTQLQATINGEANPEINITKTSANTPPHNVNGSDRLEGNGCETQFQATTNENGHENDQAIDNTGNENNNEQTNDNRTGGQQNNQGSNYETQHEQDSGNNKPREIGSSHTTHSEQELRNPNISQPKWPTTSNHHTTRTSKTGQLKSVPNKSLGSPEARANSDTPNHFTPKQEQRKKADATRPVQDPRNRNKDSTPITRQKQSTTPRLTSRIGWTEQKGKEEGCFCDIDLGIRFSVDCG